MSQICMVRILMFKSNGFLVSLPLALVPLSVLVLQDEET